MLVLQTVQQRFKTEFHHQCYQIKAKETSEYFFIERFNSDCRRYRLSYESCKSLLYNSNCTDAIYSSKTCALNNRRAKSFRKIYRNRQNGMNMSGSLVWHLSKTFVSSINCDPNINVNSGAAAFRYKNCLEYNSSINLSPVAFSALPYLNIVISVSKSWALRYSERITRAVFHWKCYCKHHGYDFTLNIIDASKDEFMIARHEHVQFRYLFQHQYVMHLDADSLVLNMSTSIECIIKNFRDKSLFLQMRENGEITSAIYIAKSDHRSLCFLQYWREFHPPRTSNGLIIPVPNNCNGALVSATLWLAAGNQTTPCLSKYSHEIKANADYAEYECSRHYQDKLYGLGVLNNRNTGLYVFWPVEGLWRSHEKKNPNYFTWFADQYSSCFFQSDFIGHGNKQVFVDSYYAPHFDRCALSFIPSEPITNFQMRQILSSGSKDKMFSNDILLMQNINSQQNIKMISNISKYDPNCSSSNITSELVSSSGNPTCWWRLPVKEIKILRRYCIFNGKACLIPVSSAAYSYIWTSNEDKQVKVLAFNGTYSVLGRLNLSLIAAPNFVVNENINACLAPTLEEFKAGFQLSKFCSSHLKTYSLYKLKRQASSMII